VVAVLGLIVVYNLGDSPVCYFDNKFNDGKNLKELNESLIRTKNEQNIFFHETSCNSQGIIRLNARQSCAIESSGK
jgi:lactosylceramide 4-alpha-galactosyltransferase